MQRTFSPLMGQGMVDLEGTVKEPSDEEDEDNIDQFNDDTFGPGALDEDWEAAHERLAGLRLSAGGHCMFNLGTNDDGYELGEAELEESLSKLVLEEDLDDTAVVASRKQPIIEIPLSVHSIWGTPPDIGPFSHLPPQFEDEAIVRAGKAMSADEVRQSLLNRAPPPRSTSPVFGSPPVHTAPIGTPPKYPPHPQQILRPIPTHLRPHLHQPRFHGAFNGRLSPIHSQSPGICGPPGPRIHGFPSMQRASLLHHQSQAGRLSPSQFSCLPTVLPSPLNPLSPLPHKLLPGCRPHLIHPYVRPPHFMSPPAMHVLRSFPRPVHPGDLHPQHRRLLNLQQQRGKSQQNGVATGCHPPGTGCPSSFDPYANLMTQREKEWVVRIQMLQLQSGGSGVNDYYYKMYFERLERRAMAGDATSGGISKKREPLRLITPQVALAEHTYTPMQFHGSLGKLTVSSVNNPRKMIDTGPLARSDDEELKDKQGRDKRRRVLQAIEQAYSLLLQLEDLECLLSRSTPAERDEVALRHVSCQRQLFNMPCKSCTSVDEDEKRAWEEGFVTMMTVRKGRRLIGRMLPFLLASQQAAIVMATANHITHVVRKDSADEVLLPFLPAFSLALGAQSLPTLTTVLEILTRGTASSLCLTNRFTAGFVYALVTCGERKLDGSISYVPIEARQRWLDILGTISGELNRTLGVGGEQLATTPLPPAVLAAFRRVRTPYVNPTLVPGPLS